jgi:hypothetical protein
MTALGILLAYFFCAFLVLAGLVLGWKIFTTKTLLKKTTYTFSGLLCFFLLGYILVTNKKYHNASELQFVGTYYLTKYPNFDSCEALLKEDNSFVIKSYRAKDNGNILETGNWHFVAEGDFLGVYMDKKENELLGSNRFEYSYHIDQNNKVINAPVIGF